MKKILSVVAVFALLVVGAISAKAQLGDGVSIYGDGQIYLIYGGETQENLGSGAPEPRSAIGDYQFVGNLNVKKVFEATGGSAILHLRGASASVPSISIGRVRGGINDNYDPGYGADQTNKTNQAWLFVKELYYLQPIADNLVVLTIGKTAYLGGNVNAVGGIGSAFTDTATTLYAGKVDGANRNTIKIDVNPIEQLTVSYGYSDGVQNPSSHPDLGFGYNGYNAFQVNVKPIAKTNLRVGYWFNNTQNAKYDDDKGFLSSSDETEGASGIYFSGDVQVVENVTIGAKFGKRLDDTTAGGILDFSATPGASGWKVPVDMEWEIGGKIGGTLWGRSSDYFFLGVVGYLYKNFGSDDNKVIVLKDMSEETLPMEIHIEADYAYALGNGLALTAFVQYVTGIVRTAAAGTANANTLIVDSVSDSGIAGGLKLSFNF